MGRRQIYGNLLQGIFVRIRKASSFSETALDRKSYHIVDIKTRSLSSVI